MDICRRSYWSSSYSGSSWSAVLLVVIILASPQTILPSHGQRGRAATASGSCELPAAWEGRWFEHGERKAVSIEGGSVSHKGECVDRRGDMYVFEDRSQDCFRCAVMHQKHENVIQYKETLCEDLHGGSRRGRLNRRRLTDLCYSLTADASLVSLFRLDSAPSPCPIAARESVGKIQTSSPPQPSSFSMTYSRGHGECAYPMSSVSHCSDTSRMVFRYQACADIRRSESSVEELRCLGSWKEGSTHYFLGLMNHSRVTSEDWEGRFRCFAYQGIFDGFHLSQSGEATCNLYSAREGDRTMTLKKVRNHGQTCQFPVWMTSEHRQFHNLNRSLTYHFNEAGTSLTVTSNDLEKVTSDLTVTSKLKCSSVERDTGGNFSRVITQVNYECESGFLCVESERKSERVMSVRMGRFSRNPEEACNTQLFFDDAAVQTTTLISAQHFSSLCPLVGKYSLRDNSASDRGSNCVVGDSSFSSSYSSSSDFLMFGCAGESKFQLSRGAGGCGTEAEVKGFSCHGSWREPDGLRGGHVEYLIVKESAPSSERRLCARISESGSGFGPSTSGLNVSLVASDRDCPRPDSDGADSDIVWDFSLSRASECAQALATANQDSSTASSSSSKKPMEFAILATSWLFLLLQYR